MWFSVLFCFCGHFFVSLREKFRSVVVDGIDLLQTMGLQNCLECGENRNEDQLLRDGARTRSSSHLNSIETLMVDTSPSRELESSFVILLWGHVVQRFSAITAIIICWKWTNENGSISTQERCASLIFNKRLTDDEMKVSTDRH